MGRLDLRSSLMQEDKNGFYIQDGLLRKYFSPVPYGDIGQMGQYGAGVGVCPPEYLPDGFTPLDGVTDRLHPNYGNYIFRENSVAVQVPKFWYKYGTGANGLPVNLVDIKGRAWFENTTQANDFGYALHRAFIDGGVEIAGKMVDKYMCSKNAWGTGFVGSSLKYGLPISMHPDHNPINGLTACTADQYYEAFNACKARDGGNGLVNPASIFYPLDQFTRSALALIALAHGQAAAATGPCAWFDPAWSTNFPKGCNNNALKDVNDATVVYLTDGYSNCGKTGSGTPFSKTTHNGQASGIADLNGLIYEVSPGVTCIAASKNVAGATKANPCVIQVVDHGRTTGDIVMIQAVVGMTQLNDKLYTVTVVDPDHLSLDGVDSSGYTDYASAGLLTYGTFYAAKETTALKNFTAGNTLATDHWGAVGVAAMMEAFLPPFKTAGGVAFAQRFGSGVNQVLSSALSGAGWLLTGLGMPRNATAIDASGTSLFGQDYFYQFIRNELCLIACAHWSSPSYAGVWALHWGFYRAHSGDYVGFRAACSCLPG